jgi:hypothetical protein
MIFWLVLKLEISVRSYDILNDFWFLVEEFFFRRLCLGMVKYLNFHNSSFGLMIYFLM